MNDSRKLAEQLRAEGYSYNMISEKLSISKSTLSEWLKDRPFTPNMQVLERIQYGPMKSGMIKREQRLRGIEVGITRGKAEIGSLSKRDLWMLGLGLYIGEGAKTIESIRISNSDPFVIATSIKWLKEICGLSDNNITIRMHIYPDNDEIAAKKYWKEVTKLPLKNFRTTVIDMRANKNPRLKSKLPYGTVHISVVSDGDREKGVILYRKIQGWVAGAMNLV